MKKNVMFVLAIMAMVFSVVSAAKAELIELTPLQMKRAFCQNGIDFQVVTSYDTWSGYETNIVPAKTETPPLIYTVPVVVQAGTDLAAFFPVGTTVINHVASVTNTRGGTITDVTDAGTSTYGPAMYIRTCLPPSANGFTGIVVQPR